jgi:hypothetical protein
MLHVLSSAEQRCVFSRAVASPCRAGARRFKQLIYKRLVCSVVRHTVTRVWPIAQRSLSQPLDRVQSAQLSFGCIASPVCDMPQMLLRLLHRSLLVVPHNHCLACLHTFCSGGHLQETTVVNGPHALQVSQHKTRLAEICTHHAAPVRSCEAHLMPCAQSCA